MDSQGNYLADNAAQWAMVRDNTTGLVWEVKTDDGSIHDRADKYTWCDTNPSTNGGDAGTCGDGTDTEDFLSALNAESFGGFSDWRLPTREELRSIVDYGRNDPAIDTALFPKALSGGYWSSTAHAHEAGYMWIVGFGDGIGNYGTPKSGNWWVRAVRGEGLPHIARFVNNGDGTVTDTATGLMWQQATADAMNLPDALSYCEGLVLGGHDDWRLPSVRELTSVADLSRYDPAMNTTVFPDTAASQYSSSTTYTGDERRVWHVEFRYGGDDYGGWKSNGNYVRAVRGGQDLVDGHLHLTSPQQASDWRAGELRSIRWKASNVTGNLRVSLSRDGGKTYETVTESTENDGIHEWTVAEPASVNCTLKIEPVNEPSKGAIQGLFSIVGDLDGDGVSDDRDECPATPSGMVVLPNGCVEPETDYPECTVKSISVGDAPRGIAIAPDESCAYVANSLGGSVSVIRLSDNTEVLPPIVVGGRPNDAAVTPDGRYVYVTDYEDHYVSVIQTSDNTLVSNIEVGLYPNDVAITPDGNTVYVTNGWHGTVSVIRTSDNTVVDTIPVGGGANGIVVSPDGNMVYVANDKDGTVSKIRTSDNEAVGDPIDVVGDEPVQLAITPDGRHVYVSDRHDSVSVIRTADDFVSAIYDVGEAPYGIAVTPGGAYVFVVDHHSMAVRVIQTSDNTVIDSVHVPHGSFDVAVATNGTVYVSNESDDTIAVFGICSESDTDKDGMEDDWEIENFGDLSHDGKADTDSDELNDLQEYQEDTDPNDPDSDDDGMVDGWEVDYGLDPNADDAGSDPDEDRFTNGREYQDQTDPTDNESHLILPEATGRIPDTGQTKCYDSDAETACPGSAGAFYGQDANYTINPPSYIKMDSQGNYLPDGAASWAMVRDSVTGLVWEIKTDDGSIHDRDNTYTWCDTNPDTNGGDAGTCGDGTDTGFLLSALNTENFGGSADWRLPTQEELRSIADYGRIQPAVTEDYFPRMHAADYWSSTTLADDTSDAWCMRFTDGVDYSGEKPDRKYVRAVRGEQARLRNDLSIHDDGTVTDASTGLMWQQVTVPEVMNWQNALSYCEGLSLGGHDDWRLPSVKELASLADMHRHFPAIHTGYFPDTVSSLYWSSTTTLSQTHTAWFVDFYDGTANNDGKPNSRHVRAVRGGQGRKDGHLYVTSPSQASSWSVGKLTAIAWDPVVIAGNVEIAVSRDGGGTYGVIAESTENDGSYEWIVTGPESVNCMLRIVPANDPASGTVQGHFTIGYDLNRGMVAYYPFDGDANDESGNGNHGAISGAVLSHDRNGEENRTYSLDGVDDYIRISDDGGLDITREITIAAWVKIDSIVPVESGTQIVVAKWFNSNGDDNDGSYILEVHGDTSQMILHIGPYANWCESEVSMAVDTWYHVVGTYDGSRMRIYVNGEEANSTGAALLGRPLFAVNRGL